MKMTAPTIVTPAIVPATKPNWVLDETGSRVCINETLAFAVNPFRVPDELDIEYANRIVASVNVCKYLSVKQLTEISNIVSEPYDSARPENTKISFGVTDFIALMTNLTDIIDTLKEKNKLAIDYANDVINQPEYEYTEDSGRIGTRISSTVQTKAEILLEKLKK